jgi:hypothetical protein
MSTGHKIWVIAGGQIPLLSTGKEPGFTSRDVVCILNTGEATKVNIMIYYEDKPPAGPYRIELKEICVRQVRFNDLVDPLPIPLNTIYAAVIESDNPVLVQFTRMDTGHANKALLSTMAFPGDT